MAHGIVFRLAEKRPGKSGTFFCAFLGEEQIANVRVLVKGGEGMATIIISDQVQQPWGEWLTKCLSELGARNLSVVVIAAIDTDNKDTITGYWHCSPNDKLLLAGTIQSDAMLDCVKANISSILGEADDTDGGSG